MGLRAFVESVAARYFLVGAGYLRLRWAKAKFLMAIKDVTYAKLLFAFRGERWDSRSPRTYNEKLWFLKLSLRDPLITQCSDKHAVRDYVKACGLEHILKRTYGVYRSAGQLNFDALPSPTYLKCSHGSGLNWVYRRDVSRKEQRRRVREFDYVLRQNPYYLSREWNYRDISPVIVCEEYLESIDGEHIPELQFFCFGGQVRLVMYNLGLADFDGNHQAATRWVFSPAYELLKVRTSMQTSPDTPPRPPRFDDMLRYAEILSAPFRHVRVDLFSIGDKVYFNELTFYSGGGFVRLEPLEWQEKLGSWLDVSGLSIAPDATSGGLRRVLNAFSGRDRATIGC